MFAQVADCVVLTHLKHLHQKWVKLEDILVDWVTRSEEELWDTESTEQSESVSARLKGRLFLKQSCIVFTHYTKSLPVSGPYPPPDVGVKTVGNNTSAKNGSVKMCPKPWTRGWFSLVWSIVFVVQLQHLMIFVLLIVLEHILNSMLKAPVLCCRVNY